MTGSSKKDSSIILLQQKTIPFRKNFIVRARWADAAAGQRPASCACLPTAGLELPSALSGSKTFVFALSCPVQLSGLVLLLQGKRTKRKKKMLN